jgi:gamma-glutamyltranspeptidase/glutathione hydrolase
MNIGGISTSNQLATEAGFQILQSGGNAFDAAITIASVLGVVEPANSGLGGGGLWLLRSHESDQVVMLDSREVSPQLTDSDIYKDNGRLTAIGALACAIPGVPAAIAYINKQWGSMSLDQCLEPAVNYAEKGFLVDADYQRLLRARIKHLSSIADMNVNFVIDGQIPPIGHRIIQKDLAQTLKVLAQKGHDGFYKGDIAKKLVNGVLEQGGIWTIDDLANYKVKIQKPLKVSYHNATIYVPTGPSSGGIQLLLMLKIIDIVEGKLKPKSYTDEIHLLLETMYKSYYYKHFYLGDSTDMISHLNSQTLEKLSHNIRLDSINRDEMLSENPDTHQYSEQTTHFSIIDKWGNCVSATVSNNLQFGSGVIPKGTGVVLNNQMNDFSELPSSPNYIGPNKRPLSNMTPAIIDNGKYSYLLGTPGGSRIPTMMFLSTMFLINNPELLESTTVLPRFHHQYYPDHVEIEPGAFTQLLSEGLVKKGHIIQTMKRKYGNMQVVAYDKDQNRVFALTDPRYSGYSLKG